MSAHSRHKNTPCAACGDLDGCHRSRRTVYIATRLEQADVHRGVARDLGKHGWELTYDWTKHGSVQSEGLGRIGEVARAEHAGVRDAEVVVVILPGGRGTHTELGMALGMGKEVVLWSDDRTLLGDDGRTCAFYHHPLVRIVANRSDIAEACELAWGGR